LTTALTESVLSLPAELADSLFREGFTPACDLPLDVLDRGTSWTFEPRSVAETDANRRHLVTYTVLRSGDMVFRYRRGKSGSEARLHDRLSLGVGGHVCEEDMGLFPSRSACIQFAAFREITEEIKCKSIEASDDRVIPSFLGWLKDSSTPVNSVHLGVVFALDLATPTATAREDCLADARWVSLADVRREREQLETWSRILVDSEVI
jgi:predicted NUDIX family phosphoesterase